MSKNQQRKQRKQSDAMQQFRKFQDQYKDDLSSIKQTMEQFVNKGQIYNEASQMIGPKAPKTTRLNAVMGQKVYSEALIDIENRLGTKLNQSEKQTLRYMLAADDFDLLGTLRNSNDVFREHIIPIMSQVAKQYGAPLIIETTQLLNSFLETRIVPSHQMHSFSQIQGNMLAALLDAEFKYRVSAIGVPSRTALAGGKFFINVTSNAVGNAVVSIANFNLSSASAMVFTLFGTTLDLQAGTGVLTATQAGPIDNNLMPKGFAVCTNIRWIPTLPPINAAGELFVGYYPETPIPYASLGTTFPSLQNIGNAPYFQTVGISRELRITSVLGEVTDLDLNDGFTNADQVTFFIFTGLPAVTNCGRLEVTYSGNGVSRPQYMNVIAHDTPISSTATFQFYTELMARYPWLPHMTHKQSQVLTSHFSQYTGDYERLVRVIESLKL